MVKAINILLLFVFMNFMSAPTIASVFDIDLPTSGFSLSEEEENHSSAKKSNSFSEEEVKFLVSFDFELHDILNDFKHPFFVETNHTIKEDLVLKIPSPPPEFV